MLAAGEAVPWVEKYRPATVADVEGQPQVVAALRASLAARALPHLLFHGPPGTGKTSTALALARDLFGADARARVLELNASDERGISVVRERVRAFAQTTLPAGGPPFKLIILDEADALTSDAQTALRRVLETNARTTRFCLICNYASRIIAPLASRCARFRFLPVARDAALGRLARIAAAEGVSISGDALASVLDAAEGDMRRATTLLQTAHRLCAARRVAVSPDSVAELACVAPCSLVEAALSLVSSAPPDGQAAFVFAQRSVVGAGHAAASLLRQLSEAVLADARLCARRRALAALWAAHADARIADGASEGLQLAALLGALQRIYALPPDSSESLLLPGQL